MTRYRGVIFDCDGVLFDSRPANLAYYNRVLEQLGEPLVSADDSTKAHLCHTAASSQVFAQLLAPEQAAVALAIASRLDYRDFIPYLSPHRDMPETLSRLSRTTPLAVATNRTATVHQLLAHFELSGFFRAVVTSSDVPHPKPDPGMLHLAARRLGVVEAQLLYVGDSEVDARAAAAAGIPFLAYGGEVGGAESVANFTELADYLGM